MKKKYTTALIFAGIIGSSSAATFAINFGNITGAPGTGASSVLTQSSYATADIDDDGNGDVWNNLGRLNANTTIGNGVRGTIQDFTGSATSHTVTIAGFSGLNNNDGNAAGTAAWNNALDVEQVGGPGGILSSVYFTNGLGTITFGGFDANETDLRVEIFSVLNSGGAAPTTYTVNGASQDHVRSTFFTSNNALDGRVLFDGVTADASGNVVVTTTGNGGVVSSVRFSPVPEPSSTALLGLGGLALILRRRK